MGDLPDVVVDGINVDDIVIDDACAVCVAKLVETETPDARSSCITEVAAVAEARMIGAVVCVPPPM